MKVYLLKEEKYPDLILTTEKRDYWEEVEVPDELVEAFTKVRDEYNKTEEQIFDVWDRQKKVKSC